MKKLIASMIAAALCFAVACENKQDETAEAKTESPKADEKESASDDSQKSDESDGQEEDEADEQEKVEVAAKGTKFDPSVDPQRLPEGAWFCDMGDTHWAAMEKGDGKCAVCGMKLKQFHAEDYAGHHDESEHGHDHDEEDHGHGHDEEGHGHGHDEEGHGHDHGDEDHHH